MLPVVPADDAHLDRAARALRAGALVAFPTETVYGLGGHALDARAVAAIFAAKRRPHFDPLIVHIAERRWLEGIADVTHPLADALMRRFWPGPLTLVLPKRAPVPDLATAGLPSVAVRMPAHPVALALIARAGVPVAAPSANPFGALSPTRAGHVAAAFGDGIAYILDGGECPVGVESTVLSLLGETPVLLRAGGLPREDLEAAIGPVALAAPGTHGPLAPGMLPQHYAPRAPLRLLPGASPPAAEPGLGLLAFRSAPAGHGYAAAEILSPAGDLAEAAARLFACLHRLDAAGVKAIHAEPVPERGLGLAILDRLRKAQGLGPATGPAHGK